MASYLSSKATPRNNAAPPAVKTKAGMGTARPGPARGAKITPSIGKKPTRVR